MICDFLLIANSYRSRITVCEIFSRILRLKIFAHCIVIAEPYAIVIYASLKSTFSGLQFCCWQYGSISFSRCCLPNLRNHTKFRENSNFSSQSKAYAIFYYDNFGRISYGFRDIDA